MIETLIVLLVLGAATVVFYPALAGMNPRPGFPARRSATGDDTREELAVLIEHRDRLIRNLRELETERAAGRIAEADYADFKRRDESEAARVMRELSVLEATERTAKPARKTGGKAKVPAGAEAPRRKIGTTLAWIGGTAAFAIILGLTMSKSVAPRTQGGTITGTLPGENPGGGGAPAGAGGGSPMFSARNPERLAALEKLIARDSSNVKNLLEASHLCLAEQRLDEAAQLTIKALSIDPQSPEAHAHIGVLMMAEAQSQQNADSAKMAITAALEAMNQAIKLDPKLPEAWLFKGMVLMAGMQDRKGAAEAWAHYLTIAPANADTSRIAAMVRQFNRAK